MTLLTTLQSFITAQRTRRNVQLELEQALSSFLSQSPSGLKSLTLNAPEPELGPATVTTGSGTACANEAAQVRAPNDAEMVQVLKIGFEGLVEVRNEVDIITTLLRDEFDRKDLAQVVDRIERLEASRTKESLMRDQYRRLAVLEPERDFHELIAQHDKKQAQLALEINEQTEEITAEIADLSAAD